MTPGRTLRPTSSSAWAASRQATRIRAIVSASLTSGSPSVGCFLPTYSGRAMFAGTCRVGESRPGWSKVAMFWESNVHGLPHEQQWWFCTRHNTVEGPDTDCPGKDLLGPYATREEAANALEKVKERNEEWDAQE